MEIPIQHPVKDFDGNLIGYSPTQPLLLGIVIRDAIGAINTGLDPIRARKLGDELTAAMARGAQSADIVLEELAEIKVAIRQHWRPVISGYAINILEHPAPNAPMPEPPKGKKGGKP